MSLRFVILAVISGLLIAYGAGFWLFIRTLPIAPTINMPTTPAAVVFTGSPGRISVGLDVMQQGYPGTLMITGLHPKSGIKQLPAYDSLFADAKERITLDVLAQTTRDNARVTAHWLGQQQADSVTLITAAYHLPRSRWLLQKQAPEIEIVDWPVYGNEPLTTIWREYNKFLAVILRLL